MKIVGNTNPPLARACVARARARRVLAMVGRADVRRDGRDAHERASCRRETRMTTNDTTNTTRPSRKDRAAA